MLAMYVVLENYLGMVCDYPAAYEGQPGFEFIREVPTVWDETKVLDAKPGEYILIARRKNQDWWLGAITNHNARNLQVPCTFLSEGHYQATTFTDAPDAHSEPNHLSKETRTLNKSDLISVSLSDGGGFVAHLRKE
jgi:alpha-glucosidase